MAPPKLSLVVDLSEFRRPERVQGLRHAAMASRRSGSEGGGHGGGFVEVGGRGWDHPPQHTPEFPVPNEHRCACGGRPRERA